MSKYLRGRYLLAVMFGVLLAACSREAAPPPPDPFASAGVDPSALALLCDAEASSVLASSSAASVRDLSVRLSAAAQRLEPYDYLASTIVFMQAASLRHSPSNPADMAATLRRAAAKLRAIR